MSLSLLVRREGQADLHMPLRRGVTSLGRADDNDVCLADIGVSRRHARLVVDGNEVHIEDLGSGNGTWIDGKRVRRQALRLGQEVVIDPFQLSVEFGVAPSDAATQLLPGAQPILPEDPPEAFLHVVRSPARMDMGSYPVTAKGLNIGRAQDQDIVLLDAAASRHHATLVCVAGMYWLKDPGSANGVHVNERRVREHLLQDGDVLRVGATEFRFERLENSADHTDLLLDEATPPMPLRRGREPVVVPPAPAGQAPAPAYPQPPPPAPPAYVPAQQAAPAYAPPAQQAAPAYPPPAQQAAPAYAPPPAHAPAPAVVQEQADRPSWLLPVLIGGAALFAMVSLGAAGLGAWTFRQQLLPQYFPTTAVAESSEEPSEIGALMAQGRASYDEGRYFEATSSFLGVLKLDPEHAEAEHMGYRACEAIVLDEMLSEVVKQAEAREAAAAKPRKRARPRRRSQRPKAAKPVSRIEKAQTDLAAGRYTQAISGFKSVIAADPSRTTPSYYAAEEGLAQAQAALKETTREPYRLGIEAMRRGDLLQAREHFQEVLRLDPGHSGAKRKLEQVERELAR